MLGANRAGDRAGELSFVVRLFLEAERKRVNGRLVRALREGCNGTRVDAARQEHAERHICDEVTRHAVLDDVLQFGLTDWRLRIATRYRPVRPARHRARVVRDP